LKLDFGEMQMIHSTADARKAKGWFVGPWNSAVPVPVGYANEAIDVEHYHAEMYEVYLIAQGTSTAIVDDEEVSLTAGDILVVEPNEVHTFTNSSANYLHFVIHTPFVKNDKHIVE
jgi:mannose-6-phosphate isomerase-like protein (cupin superfamily)